MNNKLLISALFIAFSAIQSSAQWYQQVSGTGAAFTSISSIHDDTVMTAGVQTTCRKTVNGGTVWNQSGSTGITSKTSLRMRNDSLIIFGQINGTFRRSTNGGATWTADIFGGNTSFHINDIDFVNDTDFIAVGGSPSNHATGGRITTLSTNAGASWPVFYNVSGSPTLFGIHVRTPTSFVACGGAESIYRSPNGGVTWNIKTSGTANITLYDLHFPNNTIGYAVGGDASKAAGATGGVVYRSLDGGNTWAKIGTGLLPNSLYGVHFINPDTGYVVGHGGFIQVTTDSGATWTAQQSPVTSPLSKINFTSNKIGYAVGDSGVIIKTTTGGFIPPFTANVGPDVTVCAGTCDTLEGSPAAVGGTPPYEFHWSHDTSIHTSSAIVCPTQDSTWYTFFVIDLVGDTAKDSALVVFHPAVAPDFTGLAANYCRNAGKDTLIGIPAGGIFSGTGVNTGNFDPIQAGIGTHTVLYTYTDSNGCITDTNHTSTVLGDPNSIPLCVVSADSLLDTLTYSDSTIIVWEKPAKGRIDSFRLYKNILLVMQPIGTFGYNEESRFVDVAANPNTGTNGWEYAMTVIDTCGYESPLGSKSKTMYLNTPTFAPPSGFDLSWTAYQGFTFTDYEVWRDGDGLANPTLGWSKIATVAAGTTTYTDNSAPTLAARYRIQIPVPVASSCQIDSTQPVDTLNVTMSNVSEDQNSVHEISLDHLIQVFPNPSNGEFTLDISGLKVKSANIQLFNALGAQVYESAVNEKNKNLNVQQLPKGMYQLRLETEQGVARKKIIIQ